MPVARRTSLSRRLLAALLAAALLLLATGHPATARGAANAAAVPQGFVGVDADGPLLQADGSGDPSSLNLAGQMATMVANGVQSIRVAFSWSAAQPYEKATDVPAADAAKFVEVGGRPTSFQFTDQFVAAAARARLTILPIVLYAPAWDAQNNRTGIDIPRRTAPYAAYLTALIGRYGPRGSFWRENPGLPRQPIRRWQIWNEPNINSYWPQPFAARYVSLLRAARTAIKRADPGAKVVLGALTNLAWHALGQIYRVRGARSLFDIVAVNGFTRLPANVIVYMRLMRNAMDRFGDRSKPLLATEVSWPSAVGHTRTHFDFDTTQAGQARDIRALLPLIGQERRALGVIGFYWYTWIGREGSGNPDFSYAGLLGYRNGKATAKPALAAFRSGVLALEGCRSKGSVATACRH